MQTASWFSAVTINSEQRAGELLSNRQILKPFRCDSPSGSERTMTLSGLEEALLLELTRAAGGCCVWGGAGEGVPAVGVPVGVPAVGVLPAGVPPAGVPPWVLVAENALMSTAAFMML